MDPRFAQPEAGHVARLVAQYPLAWMLAPGAPLATATLLPMLATLDPAGTPVALVGHMSRRRPLRSLLEADPRAHFLFLGPHGYVSPEHSGRRDWGPTWNYAALRVEAEVRFDEDLTLAAVDRLVAACEDHRDSPWRAAELGSRHAGMLGAIIGFEARVTALDATFKMAQDEDDEVLAELAAGHPDPAMRDWIRALNRERLA